MPKRNNEAFKHDTAGQISAFSSERKNQACPPPKLQKETAQGEGGSSFKEIWVQKKESTRCQLLIVFLKFKKTKQDSKEGYIGTDEQTPPTYCFRKNPHKNQLNSYVVLSTLFPSLESQRTLTGLQVVQRILIAQQEEDVETQLQGCWHCPKHSRAAERRDLFGRREVLQRLNVNLMQIQES